MNPPGPVQEYMAIPAVAENEVVLPEQITFVPVILHEGSEFTVKETIEDVTNPQLLLVMMTL